MTYNPNANWTARKSAKDQAPVYYIAIEGLTTKHFSTGPVKAAGTTKKALMQIPDEIGQKIEQLQGRVSLRLSKIVLADAVDEITDLVSTEKSSPTLPTLVNRNVTLYEGDVTLNESDYAAVAVGQIVDVQMREDGASYELTLADLKRAQNEDLFTNAEATGIQRFSDRLGAAASAGAKSVLVANIPGVQEGDKLMLGPSTHGSFTGDEEKVEVAGLSGATVFLTGALVNSYLTGDGIRWATTILEGLRVNLIYALWTGDFANGSFPLTVAQGMPTGLGIDAALIDTAALIKERDRVGADDFLRFEVRQAVNAARFLEQRLYTPRGYPCYRGDGRLSFRYYRPAFSDDAAAGLPTLLEADIASWRWSRPHKLHVNRVVMGLDFDVETTKAAAMPVNEDTTDQADTKEVAEFELEESGFMSPIQGARLIDDAAAGLLRRYLRVPPQLTITTGPHKKAIEIGEVLSLTHSRIPNVKTGTRGYSGVRMEVLEKSERPGSGTVEFVLMDPGYARPAWIGDDGAQTDYDSASAAEKESAYIGDDSGTTFPDGGSFYEVA